MLDWSSFWGAFLGAMLNVFEVAFLFKISKQIRCMLKEFKKEGDPDRWQK